MVQFVRPYMLGTQKEFNNRFLLSRLRHHLSDTVTRARRFHAPIDNGQCVDSTAADVALMRQRTFVLHNMLLPLVHRVDYGSPILQEAKSKPAAASDASNSASSSSSASASSSSQPSSVGFMSNPQLPQKFEYVLFIKLSPLQKQLYKAYLHRFFGDAALPAEGAKTDQATRKKMATGLMAGYHELTK